MAGARAAALRAALILAGGRRGAGAGAHHAHALAGSRSAGRGGLPAPHARAVSAGGCERRLAGLCHLPGAPGRGVARPAFGGDPRPGATDSRQRGGQPREHPCPAHCHGERTAQRTGGSAGGPGRCFAPPRRELSADTGWAAAGRAAGGGGRPGQNAAGQRVCGLGPGPGRRGAARARSGDGGTAALSAAGGSAAGAAGGGERARLLPELRGRYPDLPAPTEDELTARGRLFGAVERLFDALAKSGPLVLLLEDLHWLDGASVDLLRYLGHCWSRHGSRVLLLGTVRRERLELNQQLVDLGRDLQLSQITLQPLSQEETLQLIQALVGEGEHGCRMGGE